MISLQLGEACFRTVAEPGSPRSGCEPRVAGRAAVHRGRRPARNTCTDGGVDSSVDSDDTRKPLFSTYRCPRAPVTHPPAPTPTLNQSTKIQGNFYFVFIKKSVFFFFMLLVFFFFFFSTLFHSSHSGWSRWVPGIKKMPTEVAVSRPGARPTVNTPQKGEKKTQNQPTK